MMNERKKDVFISYRRDDNKGIAREIAKGLEKRGFSVFFDTHDIVAGEMFPQKIVDAIENAYDFLIIVSQSYFGKNRKGEVRILNEEDWCRKELTVALSHKKHILPIVMDPTFFSIPSSHSEDPLKNFSDILRVFDINYIEFSSTEDSNEFINTLQELLSPQSIYNSKRSYFANELFRIIQKHDPGSINIDIRNLVLSLNEETLKQFFFPILDEEENHSLQFYAYYAIYTYYRRLSYQSKICDLVEKYGCRFDSVSFPFNSIIQSQYYLFLYYKDPSNLENLDQAIHFADLAKKNIPDNSGVLVTFAERIAIAVRINGEKYKAYVPVAIQDIKQAMALNKNYPKHYYILGLLESEIGHYEEGIRNIIRAIESENSESKDAFLRIVKYYDAIQDIKLKQLELKIMNIIRGRNQ